MRFLSLEVGEGRWQVRAPSSIFCRYGGELEAVIVRLAGGDLCPSVRDFVALDFFVSWAPSEDLDRALILARL